MVIKNLCHYEDLRNFDLPCPIMRFYCPFTENIKESFNNLTLDLDDDVYFYHSNTDGTIAVSEGYKISEEFDISFQKIGSWSQTYGLKISEPNKAFRRKDLQGKNFILSTNHYGGFLVIVNDTLLDGFYGLLVETLKVKNIYIIFFCYY